MPLNCLWAGPRLSRFLDGELPLGDYRRLRDHVKGCPRCARRLSAFRAVDTLVARAAFPAATPPSSRSAVALAVAAAFTASLTASLLLTAARATRDEPVFMLSTGPSETLAGLYERLSSEAARP
jgi:anti-sigma factor RsiW